MRREEAIRLGTAGGLADVADAGLAGALGTLAEGSVGWDEGAINAGAADADGVPEDLHEAYYEAYQAAAHGRVLELASESHACPDCGEPTERVVPVRGRSAGKAWDKCKNGHTHEILSDEDEAIAAYDAEDRAVRAT